MQFVSIIQDQFLSLKICDRVCTQIKTLYEECPGIVRSGKTWAGKWCITLWLTIKNHGEISTYFSLKQHFPCSVSKQKKHVTFHLVTVNLNMGLNYRLYSYIAIEAFKFGKPKNKKFGKQRKPSITLHLISVCTVSVCKGN